jgi:hypothetical protein
MKKLLWSLAFIGLSATILPAILVFSGAIELGAHKAMMVVGMILWFATAPLFMKRRDSSQ